MEPHDWGAPPFKPGDTVIVRLDGAERRVQVVEVILKAGGWRVKVFGSPAVFFPAAVKLAVPDYREKIGAPKFRIGDEVEHKRSGHRYIVVGIRATIHKKDPETHVYALWEEGTGNKSENQWARMYNLVNRLAGVKIS